MYSQLTWLDALAEQQVRVRTHVFHQVEQVWCDLHDAELQHQQNRRSINLATVV